jgi:hypothetical protein
VRIVTDPNSRGVKGEGRGSGIQENRTEREEARHKKLGLGRQNSTKGI